MYKRQVLREPLDRAISHHNHEVKRGFETLSLTEAFDAETDRLAGEVERISNDSTYVSNPHILFGYIGRGQYAEQLERYFNLFGTENVLVLDSTALRSDPQSTVRKATDFLGLPPIANGEYPLYNQRAHDPIDPGIRARYGPMFEASNARLRELLEPRTPSWLLSLIPI